MGLTQLANIFCGFILAMPLLMEIAPLKELMTKAQKAVRPHYLLLGKITILLGVINLLDRWFLTIPFFNGSYPQSIFAIIVGILLIDRKISIPGVQSVIDVLRPYAGYIGILAMLVGLYGLG